MLYWILDSSCAGSKTISDEGVLHTYISGVFEAVSVMERNCSEPIYRFLSLVTVKTGVHAGLE